MTRRPAKRSHIGKPLEKDIQAQVLAMVKMHPRVALAWRQNTGAVKIDDRRFVRFGFPGVSDIIGFTRTGKFIALEVKRLGQKPTQAQDYFIRMVNSNGGYAAVVYSAQDAWNLMEWPTK